MTSNRDGSDTPSRFASPPCYAAELAPDYFDPLAVDPEQARDVGRWRKSERTRLRALRDAMGTKARARAGAAIAAHLRRLLSERLAAAPGGVISAYWPIKCEPDLRDLMAELHAAGMDIALPLVETRAAPLVFRRWTPRTRMVRGHWNIPVPPPEAERVTPEIALAPVMGWDPAGYRLGYGGGYFDRTLAALRPRPFVIGIGYQTARIATIFPQPHDIAMDAIVTEDGVQVGGEAG